MIPFLKVAVVVMGILIVAGVVVLAFMMYGKLSGNKGSETKIIAQEINNAREANIVNNQNVLKSLSLPEKSYVESMAVSGGQVILLVAIPGEGQKLFFIDAQNASISKSLSITKIK